MSIENFYASYHTGTMVYISSLPRAHTRMMGVTGRNPTITLISLLLNSSLLISGMFLLFPGYILNSNERLLCFSNMFTFPLSPKNPFHIFFLLKLLKSPFPSSLLADDFDSSFTFLCRKGNKKDIQHRKNR